MMVEAEGLAAIGEQRQAEGLLERVVNAVGGDEAWRLRRGAPSRLERPSPLERPLSGGAADASPAEDRLGAAAVAYGEGDVATGDRAGARARDPGIAPAGIALLEAERGAQPAAERLVLYGDLLRAAGRERDAAAAYDRRAHLIPTGASMERTLVLVKPDGVQRGLVGEIVGRFERRLKLIGLLAAGCPRHGRASHAASTPAFLPRPGGFHHVRSGGRPALAGPDAVAVVRRLVGQTMPNQADPGTVRETSG